MSLALVTPPSVLPLSLAELRAQLRLTQDDGTDEDALIMGYLRTAVAWVERWLGQALITQVWELKADQFPYHSWVDVAMYRTSLYDWSRGVPSLEVPKPPLQTVDSVTYLDEAGDEQVLDTAVYRVIGAGGTQPAKLTLAYNQSWPSVQMLAEAVTVRFTAGYGDDGNSVPENIRQALMMLVAYHYNQREAGLIDPVIEKVPYGVEEMLAFDRVRLGMA